jgi:hypothetical protein
VSIYTLLRQTRQKAKGKRQNSNIFKLLPCSF